MKLFAVHAALAPSDWGLIAIGAVALALLILFIRNVRIVPQAMTFVIERLGTYKTTWETGIHVKMPFIDRIERRISLKERVADFPPQPVITRDNVTMQIDTVVFYQIVDPVLLKPVERIEGCAVMALAVRVGATRLIDNMTLETP